jgi:phosphate starvation-inducible protein PhoH
LTIRMKNNENVSKYYHRIFKLWQKIKIFVENRIETFLIIMKSEISTSLIEREYTNLKKLLKMTRRIEIRRKDVAHSFSRDDDDKIEKVDNNTNRNQNRINAESTFSSFSNVRQKNKITVSARYIEDHLNDKFESVNKKPDDWVSEWFDE